MLLALERTTLETLPQFCTLSFEENADWKPAFRSKSAEGMLVNFEAMLSLTQSATYTPVQSSH